MKKFLLLVSLFAVTVFSAQAQDTDSKVESLEADVASLNERAATWDKILKALPKISGHILNHK